MAGSSKRKIEAGDEAPLSLSLSVSLELQLELLWFVEIVGWGEEGRDGANKDVNRVRKVLELFKTLPTNWSWKPVAVAPDVG